jgi:hypothetical protein
MRVEPNILKQDSVVSTATLVDGTQLAPQQLGTSLRHPFSLSFHKKKLFQVILERRTDEHTFHSLTSFSRLPHFVHLVGSM